MITVELSSFTCIEMAVFDTAFLTGTFQIVNGPSSYLVFTGAGFQDDIKILKMYNDGTNGVTISYSGVKREDYLPAKGTLIIDLQANHADNSAYGSGIKNGRKGQLVHATGTPGIGNLYISGYR